MKQLCTINSSCPIEDSSSVLWFDIKGKSKAHSLDKRGNDDVFAESGAISDLPLKLPYSKNPTQYKLSFVTLLLKIVVLAPALPPANANKNIQTYMQ